MSRSMLFGQLYPDIKEYPVLTVNAVTVAFNATVHCISGTIDGLNGPVNKKSILSEITTETLELTTEPYGIEMTRRTCEIWTNEIVYFIIRKCFVGNKFKPLTESRLFPPDTIPQELFHDMAANFNPDRMEPRHYNALK